MLIEACAKGDDDVLAAGEGAGTSFRALLALPRRRLVEELPDVFGRPGIQAESRSAAGRDGTREITFGDEPFERCFGLVQFSPDHFVHQAPARHAFEAVGRLRVAHEIPQDFPRHLPVDRLVV